MDSTPSRPPGSIDGRFAGSSAAASDAERAAYQLVERALEFDPGERLAFIRRELDREGLHDALAPSPSDRGQLIDFATELLRAFGEVEESAASGDDGDAIRLTLDAASVAILADAELAAARLPRLTPGVRLGHFTILRFVAAGGMGEVYEAADERIRRRVAIKVLPAFASPERVQRFAREAQIMARVDHAAIARLYEWGTAAPEGDLPLSYIAMEFIEGVPLAEATARLRDSAPGDPRPILELLLPVLDAVAHAHARGVLHRDIKPANILVDAAGRARLLDFGVASLVEADAQLSISASSELVRPGTLAYMSPEQIRGGDARVTTQSDVYGLGLVVVESLTGKRVVATEGRGLAEIVEAVLSGEPPALPVGPRDPWSAIDFVVRRALRKDPAARHSSVAALAEDLRRVLRGEQPLGRTLDAIDALSAFAVRNRRAIVLGSLVAIGGAITVGFGASQYLRAREAEARSGVLVGGLLEGARPLLIDLHTRLLSENQPLSARQAALEKTVAYLEWVDANAGGDRRVLAEIAKIYRQVGLVAGATGQGSFGDPAAAAAAFTRSLEILDALLAVQAESDLLLLRASLRRDQAGLLELEKRGDCFRLASEDQRAAIALMPEGGARDAAERSLLITELQTARMELDLDAILRPVMRMRELAAEPRMRENRDFLSELGMAERYYADLLEGKERIGEALDAARASQRAFEASIALGLDGFTNHRHLARIELLLASRTALDRPLDETLRLLLAALERGRRSTNANPRDSFYRLTHIETAERFATAAGVVVETAGRDADDRSVRAFIEQALAAVDAEVGFAQSLPTDGAPHMREPNLLIDLAAVRERLEALMPR